MIFVDDFLSANLTLVWKVNFENLQFNFGYMQRRTSISNAACNFKFDNQF